LSKDWL